MPLVSDCFREGGETPKCGAVQTVSGFFSGMEEVFTEE